jgi:hypothetical protein
MRVIVMIKANQDSEAGKLPSEQLLSDMMKFNEELVKAGVMQTGEGLMPSKNGKRVRLSRNKQTVIDGPFAEAKELVAGFWIWKVKSLDEAVQWVKRMPTPKDAPADEEGEIEIRQIFEAEDFGETLTPELREREQSLRNQTTKA